MKIKVKLLGLFSNRHIGYDPDMGAEVDMPSGSTVEDLLKYLNIVASDGGVVISDGRVLHAKDRLLEGSCILVFPAVHGG